METSYKNIDTHKIASNYGLSEPMTFELIHEGLDNNVFIIQDSSHKKYALRISKRPNKTTSFEVEILEQLKKCDFASPRFVKTLSGNNDMDYNGTKLVLFEYINGMHIDKLTQEHLTQNMIERGSEK